ncbi:MAG: DNA-processing protein DprA, partial [Oscillospiraceae bacterium]|nr:DNA-processing protein DprA [Oscillospiraceae bacterium]
YEPPCLLYVRGKLPAFDEEVALAMVGTRKATPYGIKTAETLGFALASQGALIVSGGAEGIDAAAHRGALRAGGTTVALFAGGVDVPYPAKNEYLFRDIAATGAIISEYPPGTKHEKWRFRPRNRILSGLCLGTIVIEAPEKSGSLITAEQALEQGRDLFAVPGPIDAEMSRGCNRLLSEHAFVAMDSESVLREYRAMYPHKIKEKRVEQPKTLGRERGETAEAQPEGETLPVLDLSKGPNGLTDDQLVLVRALKNGPKQVDDLIELTDLPTRRVLSALTVLEIDGYVEQSSGKVFALQVELQE